MARPGTHAYIKFTLVVVVVVASVTNSAGVQLRRRPERAPTEPPCLPGSSCQRNPTFLPRLLISPISLLVPCKENGNCGHCEELNVPVCTQALPYSSVHLPNLLGHQTQPTVELILTLLQPAIASRCSEHLPTFLCSVLLPPCHHQERNRLPCRALCRSVRTGCESLMIDNGILWPSTLNCDSLPDGYEEECVSALETPAGPSLHSLQTNTTSPNTPATTTITSTETTSSTSPTVAIEEERDEKGGGGDNGEDNTSKTSPLPSQTAPALPTTSQPPTTTTTITTVSNQSRTGANNNSPPHCEEIRASLCKGLPYNETIFPNILGHPTQEESGLEVHQFFPLINIKCSPDLHMFLCSVYFPVCTILEKPLPPCKDFCLSARKGCIDVMTKFGFAWPDMLDCDRFPHYGEEPCIS